MAYCKNCGNQIDDNADVCIHCGVATRDVREMYNNSVYDSGSIGWAILGFFIPLVGLILWLVWMNSKPKCAKMSGIGALVGVIVNFVLSFLILGLFSSTA